jgi:aldehyde dehydrogenase (NAD+)
MNITAETHAILQRLGVAPASFTAGDLAVRSPLTGEEIARVALHSAAQATASVGRAHEAFLAWRIVPAPVRGELVRLFGEELRAARADLGRLVCIEAGKIPSEGLGEVQEMIDVCDMAVGQSRQLFGRTIATERAGHRMMETWQPIGVVGVISAFNFPVAVWCWNAALALVCGDPVVWKPSEKTPLAALATVAVFRRALARFGSAPEGLAELLLGRRDIGEVLADDPRVPVVSATGSTRMGRELGPRLARRFARPILELGGNNAGIVCPSADLGLALRAIAFSAMGTAGQRCTTLRRLFVHADVYDRLVPALRRAYESVKVGNPLSSDSLVGPLIDRAAFDNHTVALAEARRLGGVIHGGERIRTGQEEAFYVRPALVEMPVQCGVVLEETFSPITYVMKFSTLEEAVAANNAVGAGLSSSIFTTDIREAEFFMSAAGSDCGIANVNIGTSGAEVGGAFGGEKETGGGRESGSDAWKGYMRRTTNTVNYSNALPLAQGVRFELE